MILAEVRNGAPEYVGFHRSRASDGVVSVVAATCEGVVYEGVEEEREDWELHDEENFGEIDLERKGAVQMLS